MEQITVAAHVAVRLDADERAAIAQIMTALRTPRRPNVSVSDAIRAGIRELHAAVEAERPGAAS